MLQTIKYQNQGNLRHKSISKNWSAAGQRKKNKKIKNEINKNTNKKKETKTKVKVKMIKELYD